MTHWFCLMIDYGRWVLLDGGSLTMGLCLMMHLSWSVLCPPLLWLWVLLNDVILDGFVWWWIFGWTDDGFGLMMDAAWCVFFYDVYVGLWVLFDDGSVWQRVLFDDGFSMIVLFDEGIWMMNFVFYDDFCKNYHKYKLWTDFSIGGRH